MNPLQQLMCEHLERAKGGDDLSVKTIAMFAILADGWLPGDELPDPAPLILN